MKIYDKDISRRRFIKVTAGAAGAASISNVARAADKKQKRSATDKVTLGKSGLVVSRLAMGTGSQNGKVQRQLGQDGFNALVQYAYDQGITFFDTAENYPGMHDMLGIALKGFDRDKIQIQTKMPWWKSPDPQKELDRYRKQLNSDYFDTLLIHCVTTPDWDDTQKYIMDFLMEAKEKKLVKAPGVSIHGRLPLKTATLDDWGDVRMVRINHNGASMDIAAQGEQPDVNAIVANVKKMHDSGKGIIGMKLIGNGKFKDPQLRKDAMKFVMGLDCVDAVSIGFKSPAEIDEAIGNMNTYLNI